MKKNDNYLIYSFYRFVKIKNKLENKTELENYISQINVKGTILLADEGFNGSIAGTKQNLDKVIYTIKRMTNIRKVDIKKNIVESLPFNRMKIRLKKEIVSLGLTDLVIKNFKNKYIEPKYWDDFINQTDVRLLDTRNLYEIPIGKFKNAINPGTRSFREFPKKFKDLQINKNQKLALYCTGGIRCEKASAFLKSNGFKHIYQLKGGILNYFHYKKNNQKKNIWEGECFVFDKRVSVTKNLTKGNYSQCYGCRRPITIKDTKSKRYKKGVHCPHCFNKRSIEQIRRSNMRQAQINKSILKSIENPFT